MYSVSDSLDPAFASLLKNPSNRREVNKWLEEARRAQHRKHHLVAASYLRRWEVGGQIRVFEIDDRRSYCVAAAKAARDTDFYRLEHELLDADEVPPLFAEVILGKIEGMAVQQVDQLVADGSDRLAVEGRSAMSLFVASQLTRGRYFRARTQQMTNDGMRLLWAGTGPEDVREHLGPEASEEEIAANLDALRSLADGELIVEEPEARVIWRSLEMALMMSEVLLARPWGVWETLTELTTTDEPVVPLGGRLVARGQVAGAGVAHVIIFPLDPRHLLVMPNPSTWQCALDGVLDWTQTAEINMELLAHAHRWRFSTPQLAHLPSLPPPVPAAVMETDIEIVDEDAGSSMVHMFSPNRWLYVPHRPWPVAEWWNPRALAETPPTPWMKGLPVHVRLGDDGDPIS